MRRIVATCFALIGMVSPFASSNAEDAAAILAQSKAAYAALSSYQDVGEVRESMSRDMPFATAFVRPAQFRFEWTDHFLLVLKSNTVIYANGPTVRTWRREFDHSVSDVADASLHMSVAGATGISHGAAHHIATLLIPDLWKEGSFGSSVLDMKNPVHRGIETIDGVPCDHLGGGFGGTRVVHAWIGQKDHLVRRVDVTYDEDRTSSEWRRDIKTNVAIPSTVFARAKLQ
jgi:hypothetical protein